MKAYLFIETGEVRDPKDGELFMTPSGGILRCKGDFGKRSILTRHEIEIPEGLEGVSISGWGLDCGQCKKQVPCLANIPIPRPKKKVKKWKWLACAPGGSPFISGSHYSESEWRKEYAPIHEWSHSIPQTEIEAEE